jgi:dTDP-glucose 4,6-dehydratase
MPRTLIAGGAGFLGSHFCDFLLNKGHEVICMDNLITGSLENLAHIKNDKFTFIKHNVTQHIKIDGPLDFVLNFASPASPIDYLIHPIPTLKVGSLGTHNTLGLAEAKRAVYIIASTSEIYGDPLIHPQTEDYWGNVNPVGPRGVYDEAKRFSEAMVMAYHRAHGLNTKIVRIFNTYGPRMRLQDGRAIPNFIYQALKNEDITVYGDGSQTRSFCYVSDLIEGIYRLLMSDMNDPVNIGNPREMTIKEMAEKILQATQSKSKILYTSLPVDDPKVRQPDITLAKKILDWEPQVGLDEGLNTTLEYFKSKVKSP